jgi:hypothetical protein
MLTTTDQEVLIRGSIFGAFLYGVVTAVPGANQFRIPTLSAMGAGKFADATNPWLAQVLRKGTGTSGAPQGEQQKITAYNQVTGDFTTAPFTVAVAAGDEIQLLNPNIANSGSILTLVNEMLRTHNEVPINTLAAVAGAPKRPLLYLAHTIRVTGTLSAPFIVGEVVNAAPSGAAGVVVAQTAGTIDIVVTGGIFGVADTITGVTSASTVTVITAIATLLAAGTHYMVDDLVLNFANPAPDTINVNLYKLVNGVLTQTDTFSVAAGGFQSLMDMFGQDHLAGDDIEITAIQVGVAGGPYAVTGSYAYRST